MNIFVFNESVERLDEYIHIQNIYLEHSKSIGLRNKKNKNTSINRSKFKIGWSKSQGG